MDCAEERSFRGGSGEFALFGFFPEGFELWAWDFGQGGALFAGNALHFAEAAGKFGAGFFHGEFGIHVEEAGEIDGDEKDIAEFRLDAARRLFPAEDFTEFVGFLAEFLEDAFDVLPVEADASGFASELKAFEKGGKGGDYAVEEGWSGSGFGMRRRSRSRRDARRLAFDLPARCACYRGTGSVRPRRGFGLALLLFQEFPVPQNLRRGPGFDFAEDVGMPTNHFIVDFADDIMDRETALFGGDLRVEEDLEEEVAQFFGEFGVVAGVEGVEDFISFLNEIGAEGGVGLLAIPWAAAGRAEAGHEGGEPGEGGARIMRAKGFFGAAQFGFFGGSGAFFRGHARVFPDGITLRGAARFDKRGKWNRIGEGVENLLCSEKLQGNMLKIVGTRQAHDRDNARSLSD